MSYSEFSSMSAGELIVTIAVALILTILCYCTIPIILRFTLIKKKKLSKRALKGIAIINSIVVFLVIFTANFMIYGSSSDSNNSAAPMLLYAFINYWILSSGNNKYHNAAKEQSTNYASVYNSTPAAKAATAINQTANSTLHKNTENNNANPIQAKVTVADPESEKPLEKEDCMKSGDISNPETKEDSSEKTSKKKKTLPKSTKVCIAIIIVMLLGFSIGGIATYNYVAYDYYNVAYNDGYDDGYTNGNADGYNECLEYIENNLRQMGLL